MGAECCNGQNSAKSSFQQENNTQQKKESWPIEATKAINFIDSRSDFSSLPVGTLKTNKKGGTNQFEQSTLNHGDKTKKIKQIKDSLTKNPIKVYETQDNLNNYARNFDLQAINKKAKNNGLRTISQSRLQQEQQHEQNKITYSKGSKIYHADTYDRSVSENPEDIRGNPGNKNQRTRFKYTAERWLNEDEGSIDNHHTQIAPMLKSSIINRQFRQNQRNIKQMVLLEDTKDWKALKQIKQR